MKIKTVHYLAGLLLVSAASLSAETVFLDFGGSAGTFQETDTGNGNYWNTVGTSASSSSALVTSSNGASGITYTLTAGFNGANSGGASSPSTALLGDFAVAEATSDYGYVQGFVGFSSSASITLSGLDPNATYVFTFFGSRSTTQTRETQYQVIGDSTESVYLITSGTDIASDGVGDYNDQTVVSTAEIAADGSNQIVINVGRGSTGDYGYLNAIQIAIIPEPGTYALLAGLSGLVFMAFRRRR
ncbi:PEP-CTERM sorting domain-containing protein [Coraliomargarita parva]|uniref:PEP-CTERM sorting domain-containing protein n=1 Tax=Coraliomargarita parva TaxID=3014050 RepID=UPI0022B43C74|nr:PEP-CTERM sorting domain-containing protein [Coraliomargarita parva]